MKNLKTVLIVLFAIAIVILIFFLVKNIKTDNNSSRNNKMISEINFMDSKLTSLLNSINNITSENYKIKVTKTSTDLNNKETSGGENGSNNNSQEGQEDVPQQYGLESYGILTSNESIDWDEIKNDVETIYTIVPTMTLDLYSMNINQEDILNFNKELDDLTIAVKNENKDESLIKLANLYRYLPAYASNFSNDLNYISLLETKSNIFKTYVFVNLGNWDEASSFTNKSIESYSRALNNIQESRNDNTNKIYIILNEMQNAISIKDKDVFLIKYKNFVEETEKQGH